MRKQEIEKNKLLALTETFLHCLMLEVTDKMLYKNFFLPLKITKINSDYHVTIESNLSKDSMNIIRASMNDKVSKALEETLGHPCTYTFISTAESTKQIDLNQDTKVKQIQKNITKTLKKNVSVFKNDLTFDTYVEGEFNKEAIRIGRYIADGGQEYNPVFIFSKSGLGKTHLLHAIGNELVKLGRSVQYINPGDFVTDISLLLQENNQSKIKERVDSLINADVVMFDDFQNYGQGNKKSTLHVINQILDSRINNNNLTIFTSDKSITALNSMFDHRLITRLTMGLQLEIKQPRQDDLIKVLNYFIKIKNMHPNNWELEAKQFIARNFQNSIRNLLGAITRLSFYDKEIASKANAKYSLVVVNRILSSMTLNKESVTPESVIEYVAKYYKVSKKEILGKGRQRDVVMARHIAIFIIREEMGLPLEKIGQLFGNRDHSTIINAIKKIERGCEEADQSYNRAISAISEEIYKLT
ncbi:chromosomal replication initiator protein DnaA [Mycoplasma zalophidermidis]|uniref:Chromosomal replication initiator protein DnaA n=1 Tax=Mycoplasma zalophidermidis TaxID=398174 RepID=A0ABS6DR61_9MOLU|nr:chromosomal replication initiator protein DnaA [Mycoplasma zalophidermidis]MBU4689592.1 chromosomal replication initiator protein DnaA [Mycoplasma zalophidermidis]MBU4693490.1 chromosomal replication initiator protein DnaA [Mycoplasma zalophidermidis]MCR8966550.1 chromosomal replication initiator protein DnaA [Mycoplasma zalophidermidis]